MNTKINTTINIFTIVALTFLTISCQKQEVQKQEIPFVLVEKFITNTNNTNNNQNSNFYSNSLTARIYPEQEIPLSFKASGKVVKHVFTTGQNVKQGQFLAQLESNEQNIALQQAQANNALQQAQLELATKDLQRFTGLKQEGFISDAQLQQYETQAKIASKQVKISSEQIAMQKQLSQNLTLHSSKSGVIRDFQVENGQVVTAGQSIASLVVGKQVWVEVDELQVRSLKLGQMAQFNLENSNTVYDIKIKDIGQTADAINKRFLIKLDFIENNSKSSNSNENNLKIGLTGNLVFDKLNTVNSLNLNVPATAVQMQQENQGVLLLVDNQLKVQPQKVTVLERLGNNLTIKFDNFNGGNNTNNFKGFVKTGGHLLKPQQQVRIYE